MIQLSGARVSQPLQVLEHFGDSPWDVVLREILAPLKMNWNTADFACRKPITTSFSKRVGEILAEAPPNIKIRPESRFYI
jgi:RNAse (barnase) inhibitor barstar